MTSLRDAIGKPVIHRDTAEQAGEVRGFGVEADGHRVTTLVTAEGRTSRVVDWAQIQSIGPDAVIVEEVRDATPDEDRLISGAIDPLNKRVLSDLGNEVGQTSDAEVDDDGSIQSLEIGASAIDGARLRGVGSYAVVIAADPNEA